MAMECNGLKFVKKAKAGLEDLEVGIGTVTQERAGREVEITKVPIIYMVETFNDLESVDYEKYPFVLVKEFGDIFKYNNGTFDFLASEIYGIYKEKNEGHWINTGEWQISKWLKSGLDIDFPEYVQQLIGLNILSKEYKKNIIINADVEMKTLAVDTPYIKFNGGKIIIPAGQYLRWLAPIEGETQLFEVNGSLFFYDNGIINRVTLMPQHFGAKADGQTDDTAIINKTFEIAHDLYANILNSSLSPLRKFVTVKLKGIYYVTNTITVRAGINIEGSDAVFVYPYSFTGKGLVIGEKHVINENRILYLPSVIRPYEDSSKYGTYDENCVGVTLQHLYTSEVFIKRISAWGIGLLLFSDGNGTDYNNIHLGDIRDCQKVGLKLYKINDGWVNENNFWGGRIYVQRAMGDNVAGRYYIQLDGTPGTIENPNHNKFYGIALENPRGEYVVKITRGHHNTFIACRWEYCSPICFDNTRNNAIVDGDWYLRYLQFEEINGAYGNVIYGSDRWEIDYDMGNYGMQFRNISSSNKNIMSFYKSGETNEENWTLSIRANHGFIARKNIDSSTNYYETRFYTDKIYGKYGDVDSPTTINWLRFVYQTYPVVRCEEDFRIDGFLRLGSNYYLWVDSAGRLRIHNSRPSDLDSDGTIVGTQS